ncbi:DUF3327 domain-containing protein [Pseudomonas aeruginosa]|nr:enterochelin esterase domain-containing protein [Pseudomonas aeruginosa]MBA5133109.1 DUF3327 domain-containing protein [Pseudomonas aeruginosa]
MSAVSTSLLLFLNLLTPAQAAQPVPLADGRIEIAAGESRQRYLDLAPGELQLLDLEVDRGRVRLRATTPDGKALRATELAGRQSLGLQAGERQGLRLTFSADEDTALTLIPTQRLTPQTPALDSPAPQSPTLQRLQAELAEKRPGALKAFWKQVAKQGTPLVEPLDAERVLVTFLWRQQRPGDVRLLWPTPEVNTRRFEALAGSDVRYLSLPLRRDARVSYQLSADLPDLQQADRGTLRLALQAAARPDPLSRTPWLNSRALPRAEQASLVQLGGAPAETWDQPRKDVPRGKVERLGYTSQALANQRQLTLYTPPGYDPEGQRYPLLVLFDEDHYARDVPTPTILDNLIAAGRIRPTLAVIVGNVDASSRGRELPCNEAFADMLALCIERGACRSRAFRFQLRRAGLGLHRLPLSGTLRQGAEPVRLVLVGAGRAAAAVAGTAVRRWRAFAAGVLPQFRPARGARGGRHSRQQPQPARGAARQGLPAALP